MVRGTMEQKLWKESLLQHRVRIIQATDPNDVVLNHLIDYLLAARCLQLDQKEVIMNEKTSRTRCGKLLDYVHTEGKRAFNELCKSLEEFGTEDKKDLVDSIREKAESKRDSLTDVGGKVEGLTFINNTLFVLRYPSKEEIQVYETSTFTQHRTVRVAGLRDDWTWFKSLTSCEVNNCLFVSDRFYVFRVDPSTDDVVKWRVDGMPSGLSVNEASHVIVTCHYGNEIREYKPDGHLVRRIRLPKSLVTNPMFAIQLTDNQFLVSHHGPVSGVSLIDTQGEVTASFRSSRYVELLNGPSQLAVLKNGLILVADVGNHRLVVLDSSLSSARDITLPNDHQLQPFCLFFNESLSKLYVGGHCVGGHSVRIFDNIVISV